MILLPKPIRRATRIVFIAQDWKQISVKDQVRRQIRYKIDGTVLFLIRNQTMEDLIQIQIKMAVDTITQSSQSRRNSPRRDS